MTPLTTKHLDLMLLDVAQLRRDWSFFFSVFIASPEDAEANATAEMIEDCCPNLGWHLVDLLQNSMILRLCTLIDRGADAISFARLQQDLFPGDVELGSRISTFTQQAGGLREIRNEWISHSLDRKRHRSMYPIGVQLVKSLVEDAIAISDSMRTMSPGSSCRLTWNDGDVGSATDLLLLLETAQKAAS